MSDRFDMSSGFYMSDGLGIDDGLRHDGQKMTLTGIPGIYRLYMLIETEFK